MKKTLLFGLSLSIGLCSVAQTSNPSNKMPKTLRVAAKPIAKIITGFETNADAKPASERPANPIDGTSFQRASSEIIVGNTTYDLQTNAACQDRIVNHGNGNLSVVFTRSTTNDIGASDRGTGYTYFNVTTTAPVLPTGRTESSRTGWPNIDVLASGKEVTIAHNTSLSKLTMMKNGGVGSPSWAQTDLNTGDQVWNRMGTGGYDGNSIHQVSLRAPSGLGGAVFGGVDGALLYYRSLDGGNTWDIQGEFLPGLDSSNYTSMSGDSYTLQVRDSVVAVCYWGALTPTILAKSTDNGDTWTWTQIIDHGFLYDAGSTNTTGPGAIGISDANGDGVADTLDATDGAGALLIDENGMVHLTYGNMSYLDDTPGDDSWSFFPGTNGLMYWNEGMGTKQPVLIGFALDLDGDGIAGDLNNTNGQYDGGRYDVSRSGQPHMALGTNGDIYVAFSCLMETIDQGIQNYRHIYITKSKDKGCSWSSQVDVTPLANSGGLGECVFPSLADVVDTEIHLVYQRDFEPGLAVRGDNDPFGNNEIVYVNIPVVDIDAASIALCYASVQMPEYTALCPGDSVWISTSCGSSYVWSNGSTMDMIQETVGVHTVSITTSCGTVDVVSVSLTDATGSVAPSFTIAATADVICNGDSTWLSATNVTNGTYTWSDGQVGQTIGVDTAQVFTVTVSNCGGIGTNNITVSLPNLPVALVTGTTDFCLGDSTMLTAGAELSASYLWSNGDSLQSTYATSNTAYTVTVTNCAGSDVASITTTYTAAPVPTFTPSNNNFCEGTSSASMVAFSSVGDTYVWSDGSTNQSLTLNSAGTTVVNVTATNVCGDAAAASAVTITIYALPAAPTVTNTTSGSNIVFTSDATDNAWYNNGVLINGASGSTYTVGWSAIVGAEITAVAIDANNCNSVASTGITAVATGIDEVSTTSVKLYPNPNSGVFTLTTTGNGNYMVTIQNMLGQTIYSETMNASVMNFDLSNVDKGVYFVNVSSNNFETTEKVIIK